LSRGKVVARVYSLREGVALFSEDEYLVNAEHFVSKLVYLSDIFEKFSTLSTRVHGKGTIIVKVKVKLSLCLTN
jgi:hypothetical protein